MSELDVAFDDYIEKLKELDTVSKRKELMRVINEIIVSFEYIASSENIALTDFKNKALKFQSDFSEDEFLVTAINNVEVAKNILGEYLEKKS